MSINQEIPILRYQCSVPVSLCDEYVGEFCQKRFLPSGRELAIHGTELAEESTGGGCSPCWGVCHHDTGGGCATLALRSHHSQVITFTFPVASNNPVFAEFFLCNSNEKIKGSVIIYAYESKAWLATEISQAFSLFSK